jgi:hypothetical protein
MPKRIEFEGKTHVFPDDFTDAEIRTALSSLPAPPRPTAQPGQPVQGMAEIASHPLMGAMRSRARQLPELLALPGGFVPGPVGIGMSAVGGAAGEALRQPLMGEEFDVGRMGIEGAKQGAFSAGGGLAARAVGAAVRPLAAPLMRRALRVGPLAAGTTTPGQLAQQAETAVRHRVPVGGRGGQSGREIAIEAAQASGKKLSTLLDAAGKAGARIEPSDIAKPVVDLMNEIFEQPLSRQELGGVVDMMEQFIKEHPGPMTPAAVKMLKRRAQQLAEPLIKRRKIRPGTNPRDALKARFDDAIATGAKRALERIPTPMPGGAGFPRQGQSFGRAIGRRERETSRILDMAEGINRAEKATSGVTFQPFGPFRPAGTLTPNLRLSRRNVSRLALGADDPRALMGGARQTPRLLDMLIEDYLLNRSEGESPNEPEVIE